MTADAIDSYDTWADYWRLMCHRLKNSLNSLVHQSVRMSKIKKNGGLDQYGAEPFEQQQFGTAGVEGVNLTQQLQTLNCQMPNANLPRSMDPEGFLTDEHNLEIAGKDCTSCRPSRTYFYLLELIFFSLSLIRM